MKKSDIYHLAQVAVVTSPTLTPETKIAVLEELISQEKVNLFCEKREGSEE